MSAVPLTGERPAIDFGDRVRVSQRSIDRLGMAHDASHYLLVPEAIATPRDTDGVVELFRRAGHAGRTVTFRSGGTSLSGQGVTDGILVDTRDAFRRIFVGPDGLTAQVQPGATVRQVNARLARHGRKLGPDPASEIACTIGGVIANNSSGMACGITQNSYRTIASMRLVLPSGTVIDTAHPEAGELLRAREPDLYDTLVHLRARLLGSPELVARVEQQFSMKNTMGYGLNALLDFEDPVEILTHLIIGSEGTLAFVSEATFHTVPNLPAVSTGLLVFSSLHDATAALPALVDTGLATVELMDAASLRIAQRASDAPAVIASLQVQDHAALLIEFHAADADGLATAERASETLFGSLPLAGPLVLTTDPRERAALWHVRKGLYPAIAGARPSGTTALLEDIVVPVDRLLVTCERLTELFAQHGYEDAVIFGHAKDGNIHFLLNERFDDIDLLARYQRFTDDLVDLVLGQGGSLKAEHGTGRIMAPFVKRQYGAELYEMMREIKRAFDPTGMLNPGVVLSDEADSYLRDLKVVPTVEEEVDRCVECGYCEPTCPSKDITLTPRQRIVVRREIAQAVADGDDALASELRADYDYDGVQTCAVDGMCATACPVGINTGDLVRRLRAESRNPALNAGWSVAAKTWGPVTRIGSVALTVAKRMPPPLVRAATTAGRFALGADTVPQYTSVLPRGGPSRPRAAGDAASADAVFFAACIGSMFGPEGDGIGVTAAFLSLAERSGTRLVIPDTGNLCCGTPWKSKGFLDGYHAMADQVLPALLAASDGGRLPIVCDAASCTEGLETMNAIVASAVTMPELRFVDATTFAHEHMLATLPVHTRLGAVAVHHTCSTTALGANDAVNALAAAVADEVFVPLDWGCCAYAGDRGLLHPELTASATAREAAEVNARTFDAYVSANRTCEVGMTEATGQPYRHILEIVEEATRP